jgi:uracil-DNA glycosylase
MRRRRRRARQSPRPGEFESAGRPFVGPAGKLLDRALSAAGIAREAAYVTNVVKHFKWTPRGKRRLHGKPNATEIRACRPWVEAEIALVKPRVILCLGTTAAQAILGADFRVTQRRGERVASALAPVVLARVHPSSLLRGDPVTRVAEIECFVADLKQAADALG